MDDQVLIKYLRNEDPKIISTVKEDPEWISSTYRLSPEQARFFKSETGINDEEELKAHVLNIQEKAYKVFPYPCIKGSTYLRLGITTLPEYEDIIKIGKERPDGILLDIGSCFGTDARKAVADGFPLKNTVTTDLYKEFHDLSHALFKTTPATYPISFVHGDALDPNMLQIVPPCDEPPSTEKPDLATLTSLNPLAGRCAVIYASNFFHVFSEQHQLHLAKALGGLLSPEPGSMICGEQVGFRQARAYTGEDLEGDTFTVFFHSPESWCALWDGEVFSKGKVMVTAKFEGMAVASVWKYERMQWSVVRL